MTFGATMNKQAEKPFTAAMSVFSAVLVRGKTLVSAAMATMTATLSRMCGKTFHAGAATMAASMMLGRLLIAAIVTMAATLNKQTSRALFSVTSTCGVIFTLKHMRLQELFAAMDTMVGGITRRINKFFDAS